MLWVPGLKYLFGFISVAVVCLPLGECNAQAVLVNGNRVYETKKNKESLNFQKTGYTSQLIGQESYSNIREKYGSLKSKIKENRKRSSVFAIINFYRIETTTIRHYIPPCGDGRFPGQFKIPPIDDDCSQNPEGEYRYQTYLIQLADKNDGVVNIHSALWSKNARFDDQNNVYMKDVNITTLGDDGGYNHFELRNYARDYTLKENGKVVFSKEDPNPAMLVARDRINGLEL